MEELLSSLGISSAYMGPAILAVLGYFGFIFKDIPSILWSYIKQKNSITIQSDSNYLFNYETLVDFLIKNFPDLEKHTLYQNTQSMIADGSYTYYYKFMTYVLITKTRINNMSDVYYTITVTAVGLYKDEFLERYNKARMLVFPDPEKHLTVNVTEQYGCEVHDKVRKRPFDSIFIPKEVKESIIHSLDQFKISDEIYDKICMPKKMGILLTGKPGTGKSTLARAIASYMGYNVVLANTDEYKNLLSLNKKIILFEDIDLLCSPSRSLGEDSTKIKTFKEIQEDRYSPHKKSIGTLTKPPITLHLLLQTLDGLLTSDDTIFIATTNSIDSLDPALIRPGRFDIRFEIPPMDEELAKEMCDYYHVGYDLLEGIDFDSAETAASLQNKIINHIVHN